MCIYVMVYIDNKKMDDIKNNILKNTDIENIMYINKYDNYYIIKDDKYLYLLDSKYEGVLEIDIKLLHDNENNYDLIYRNNMIMYMDNYEKDEKLIFKYYDIYSYEFIDEVMVGDD